MLFQRTLYYYFITLLLSIVLPHLSYCNLVWGNSYPSYLNKLKSLQKKAIRIITLSDYNCPSNSLFVKTKILPVQELITLHTLLFMYNFHKQNVPQIFKNMFTYNSSVHSHNTRQRCLLHQGPIRTTHALNSFYNVAVNKWNNLHENIRSCTTLSKFKVLCKQELFKSYVNEYCPSISLPSLLSSFPFYFLVLFLS